MKFTIVTVAYNEERNICRTIESVLNQTCLDYEYIICDGLSKDRTVEFAKSYQEAFSEKGVRYIVNSEKDGGIYYGMNKGIELASGDYICFLNAGDWFYDHDALTDILRFMERNSDMDIFYGDAAVVEKGVVSIGVGNHENLKNGMTICHQAAWVKTELMKQRPFNVDYRAAADYDFFLYSKLNNRKFIHIDRVLVYYQNGGVSTFDVDSCLRDHFMICDTYHVDINKKAIRANRKKGALIYKIKLLIPKGIWYWWSVKVKKKTLLEDL